MRKLRLIVCLVLAALTGAVAATAQTACDSLSLPMVETFDACGSGTEVMPPCWVASRNYDIGYAPHVTTVRKASAPASLVLYPGTLAESHYSIVIAPPLGGLDSLGGLHLSFRMLALSTATRLEVGICQDTGRYTRDFIPIDTLHVDQTLRWQEMVVDLGRYSGTGRRVAFRLQRALQTDSSEVYLDDLRVSPCGTTQPWASHVGSDVLTLHFDAFGIGTVEVTYGDTVISPATSPLTLTGLTADSEYTFLVGCAGGLQQELQVHTLESAGIEPAWCERFDNSSGSLPEHWRAPTSNAPHISAGALRFTPAGDSSLAVMPRLVNATVDELTLALNLTGSGTAALVVGVLDYAAEPSTFTPVDTLHPAAGLQLLPLTAYGGTGRYIGLMAIGSGTLAADNLRLGRCLLGNPELFNLTDESVSLAWDTLLLADGATVQVEYGPAGFAAGSGTLVPATASPMALDGLTADTYYELILHAGCGDSPAPCDRTAFRTFAHEVLPPYCTGFEQETTLPQGWVASSGNAQPNADAYDGAAALGLNGATVALPLLGSEADDTLYLDFYGHGNAPLVIGLMASPYAAFVPVDTLDAGADWRRCTVCLTGAAGACPALRTTGSWSVDALALRNTLITAANVSAIGLDSAAIGWQGTRTARIEYAVVANEADDFTPGSGTTVVADSATVLHGLLHGTRYRLHVSPASDSTATGCNYISLYFTTLNGPVALPYCQNFDDESTGSLPPNWRRLSAVGEYPLVSSERNRSGSRSLLIVAEAGRPTLAILPDAIACAESRVLAFWAQVAEGAADAHLVAGTIGDITDPTTFLPTDTLDPGNNSWRHQLVSYDNLGGRHAALMLVTDGARVRLFVDDLCMETCVAYNVRAYDIDSTGFNVSWQQTDSLVLICTVHGNEGDLVDTLHTSPARFEGLLPGSTYTGSLRALCGCGNSGAAYYQGYGTSGSVFSRGIGFNINTRITAYSLPYCHTFESINTGNTPSGWRGNGFVVTDQNSYSGSHSLRLTASSRIILPPIFDPQQAALSLYLYANHEALLADSAIVVGIMTDPDSAESFTMIGVLDLSALGTWQHHTLSLTSYADSGRYIALRVNATDGTLYLDNLTVARSVLTEASVSAAGVVEWQTLLGSDSAAIEYGPAGFTSGNGTIDTAAPPYTLQGLQEGMSYDIYLAPLGEGGNCQRLKLELGNVLLTPYCEDFDAAPPAGMPQGWVIGRTYGSTPEIAVQNSNQVLHLKGAAGNRSIVVLPELSVVDLEAHQLSLRLRATPAARTRLLVGSIGDNADPNTFVPHDTLTVGTAVWQRLRLPLTRHTGGRLALACEATTQSAEVWIDSLAITRGLQPEVSIVSARSIALRNTDTNYYVDYAPVGTPQGEGILLHITDTFHLIGGLQPETGYRFYSSADGEVTCLGADVLTLPSEEALPYCHGADTTAQLILPEPAADSIAALHLYLSLRGGSAVEVGVMRMQGNWETFSVLDTVDPMHEIHLPLASYQGDGRFIALRTLDGGNAVIESLLLTTCELPDITLNQDNTVSLIGSNAVEYGPAGFSLGDGTLVEASATLQLENNTAYDFYRLCSADGTTCAPPAHLMTHMDRCPLPDSLLISEPGFGQVELGWDTAYSDFYIELCLDGAVQGSGIIIHADVQPMTLSLEPDTLYNLYVRCDSLTLTDREPQQLRTLAALVAVPYCNDFESDMVGWRVLTDRTSNGAMVDTALGRLSATNYLGTTYLVLPQPEVDSLRHLAVSFRARFRQSNGHAVSLGTMSDAANPETFDPLATFTSMGGNYTRCFHSLTNYYGNGRFLALRLQDDDVLDIDELCVTTCAAYDFTMTEMEADHVVIEWQQQGEPEISIEYGERGFAAGSGTMIHPTASPCRIDGLSPLTNYAFYVSRACADACDSTFRVPAASHTDTFFTFTPQGGTGCIDYTDLYAPYVTCAYGNYQNPMEHQGAVDYGYLSAQSRHTVHFDTAERDARTGGLLRTIPEGEQASVRLGNWTSGGNAAPQSESITYGMTVDAAEADLLLLRYAAVLQDPEHAASLQPRFRLEILNEQGQLVDSCGMADFIANANLGWNQAPGEVLWKDWTTVGVDLTAYDGQTVFVRLTTHDCGEGSHFGYAYFTLRCAAKRMLSEGCSTVPSNRFTVPDGFSCRWWSSTDTTQTISDSASILVPSDNSVTYFCQLSFVDNPGCYFTMSAFAGERYPLALFDTVLTVSGCEMDLALVNRSTISTDGENPIGTGEPCETARWLLPDGSESTAALPQLHFADTTTVTLSLVAGIASDQCLDTLTRTIAIRHPHPYAALHGPTERCSNALADTIQALYTTSYSWSSGLADEPAILAPAADTLLTCYTVDSNGCTDTLTHTLIVHPTSLMAHADTVCSSLLTYSWLDTIVGFTANDSHVNAQLDRIDRYGCDSVHTLSLSLWPSYYPIGADTICDDGTLTFFDTLLSTSGTYVHPDTTLYGCDSVVTLDLAVMPRRWTDDVQVVCDSLRWIDGVLYPADTAGVTDTLHTRFGCDSVVTLYLTVNRSHLGATVDTMCAGSSYSWRGHGVSSDSTLSAINSIFLVDTLTTVEGCDSVLTLQLTQMPLPQVAIELNYLCPDTMYLLRAETDMPYWEWRYFTASLPGTTTSHAPAIFVQPSRPTVYTLTADYHRRPLCPVRTQLKLSPYVMPQARLRVAPQQLTPDNLSFTARDVGPEYAERAWYFNDELLAETGRAVHLEASDDADTVSVALVVGDGHCLDTALALLPIERSGLVLPNAFTPDAETNRTFCAAGRNIATFSIAIYNRRGILVYRGGSLDFAWDGRSLTGEPCPSGGYVYYVVYSTTFRPTEMHKEVGTVMLVR